MAAPTEGFEESEESLVLSLVVERAATLLDWQLRDNDALDLKALGLLAADITVIGVMVAVHNTLNALWWIPTAALFLSAVSLILAVAPPREFDEGPEPTLFYSRWAAAPIIEARRELVGDLVYARERKNAPLVKMKTRFFKFGFYVLVVGSFGSGLTGILR